MDSVPPRNSLLKINMNQQKLIKNRDTEAEGNKNKAESTDVIKFFGREVAECEVHVTGYEWL